VSSEEWWKIEFNWYLNGEDELPKKTSLVQWWGVRWFAKPDHIHGVLIME
jgi:hypothetical protein